MKDIHFTSLFLFLFIFTVIAVSAKHWKKDDWEKKYVTPQKGIHYQWPKHPKPLHENWRTFHPHHNEKHTKESSKQSHHTKSYHEDKFLSHLKPKKDHIQKHYDRWEREDLHLQDLNLESRIKKHQQNHKGSHSKNNGGHHEVERMVNHHPEHFDSKSWMQHEHNINTKAFSHAHVDHHHSHHKNHKSNSHHKNHKQGDKSMKNKRKKAHEKKFNKKHSKKHFVW